MGRRPTGLEGLPATGHPHDRTTAAMAMESLAEQFGSSGEHLWNLAHGCDDRAVVPEREAKSISHETTFERDIADLEVLRSWLLELTEQVGSRLRRHGLRGRTVHLKVRFADFSTITRSQTLAQPTDITQELWQAADRMFCHRLPPGHPPVRLLGMGVAGFDESGLRQGLLFDEAERQRQTDLDATADQIREAIRPARYGVRRRFRTDRTNPATNGIASPPAPASGSCPPRRAWSAGRRPRPAAPAPRRGSSSSPGPT